LGLVIGKGGHRHARDPSPKRAPGETAFARLQAWAPGLTLVPI
jgi:hypothetical protein